MNLADRPLAPHPYEQGLPPVPSFTLKSPDMTDGQEISIDFTGTGTNVSPALKWSGFPENTKSFALNCFDPDAPTPSGYWHWTVLDIDSATTELPQGCGASDLNLEGAAFHIRNDSGEFSYTGPYPPQGDRPHRYCFAVHALDIETLELDEETMPAAAALNIGFHTIARAILTVTYQR